MKETISRSYHLLKQFHHPDGRRFAVLEGNRDCNRSCSYCAVPRQYQREKELTVAETFTTIDWLFDQGYRLMTWLGGEPLASLLTKEGITFYEHTLEVVRYASGKGILVNVTTNGDYLTEDKLQELKIAGLESLTISLHTYSQEGIEHVVGGAKRAAALGILPTIQTILSSETATILPGLAAYVAQNGIFFSFGIIQEKGKGFSAGVSNDSSLLPSLEQQTKTLQALLRLKSLGFVRNNKSYLREAPNYYPNKWICNPEKDSFIHIGAGGTVDICSDIRTQFRVADIKLLGDCEQWRNTKRVRVADCGNCLYHCYFESENRDFFGDVPMFVIGVLIRTGKAKWVEKWGHLAITMIKRLYPDTNWDI